MLRFSMVLLAGASLSVMNAHAAPTVYDDPLGRFSVGIPELWTSQKPDDPKKAATLMSVSDTGGSKSLRGVCAISVTDTPDNLTVSQEDLNVEVEDGFTAEFWTSSVPAGAPGAAVVSSGHRDQKGRKIAFVITTMTETTKDGVRNLKGKKEVLALPGALHEISCATSPELFDSVLGEFDKIFTSYDPKVVAAKRK